MTSESKMVLCSSRSSGNRNWLQEAELEWDVHITERQNSLDYEEVFFNKQSCPANKKGCFVVQ